MRGELIYVTGGARSGKSTFAEGLAMEQGHKILYIATALPVDGEMEDRIRRHRERRPSFWQTLEAYRNIKQKLEKSGERYHGILLDCATVMITNLLMDAGTGFDEWDNKRVDAVERKILKEVMETLKGIRAWANTGIIVSNEVGMGLVPDNPLGRIFRDIAGRVNQSIAGEADRAYMVVSGIPLRIK
jgi:adenosylcobinamide kinase/adenosylcobinamide-phosphate guanylyltransferase